MNSTPWLNHVSQKLAANGFRPLAPEKYGPMGFKYVAHRSRFEISKFGMAETFFTFAEIENIQPPTLQSFAGISFQLGNKNKSAPLPNGFFMSVFCYAVAITERLDPQVADWVRNTSPVKHWAAFEIPIVFDLTSGELCYFQKTPVWGAAYYAGFRREIETDLR
jgi:hypothetical protein